MPLRTSYRLLIIPLLLSGLILFFSSFTRNDGLADDVLKQTNQFRRSKGLAALQLKEDLNKLAEQHSKNMADHKCGFGHSGFEKRQKKIAKEMDCYFVAENVAYGANTGKEVVDMWKSSPGHRRNMLGDYKYAGIGIARDRQGVIYYTQILAK